jgi:RNA polymerase sigma factor (sigma-70 family)
MNANICLNECIDEINLMPDIKTALMINNKTDKAPYPVNEKVDLDRHIKHLSDDQIMEAIYNNYSNYLYTIVRNKCQYFKLNDDDIEDCFIDVIIKMCEKGCRRIRQFKGASSFKTFLTVQCRNHVSDFIRKEVRNRERFKLVDNLSNDWNEICSLFSDNSFRDNPEINYLSGEKESLISEAHDIIEKEIELLLEEDKLLAVLRLKKNMAYREIDEFLGIENSRYRLSKIFQSIRNKIDDDLKRRIESLFADEGDPVR